MLPWSINADLSLPCLLLYLNLKVTEEIPSERNYAAYC